MNCTNRTFAFSDLHPHLHRATHDLGFEQPTPIQAKTIPPGLAGRDVLACAMTGSGKTAAFLLPILERLRHRPPGATRALVLSPTRELAAQTTLHFRDLARHLKLRAAAVYGGVGMGPQVQAFRRGVDLIVACPGRLLDHFRQPYARLAELEVLVLDEADCMLDMGFLPDIKRILKHLPPVEQRLLFSATMPLPIAKLADGFLKQPVKLDIGRPAAPAAKVEQAIFEVPQALKPSLLLALLRQDAVRSALVFTRTKHRADRLTRALDRQGVAVDRIHGNRTQGQRTKALEGFKCGRTRVLVATDIAARGIDVASLSHVFNFDVPNLAEDYIHRVGRTARAEESGIALTFVAPQERGDLRTIENAVGRLPRRRLEGFDLAAAPAAGVWTPQTAGTSNGTSNERESSQGRRPQRRTGPERRTSTGRSAQGRPAQGRPAQGRPAQGRPTQGRSTQGRSTQGRSAQGRPAQGRPTQGRPTQTRSTQGRPAQERASQRRRAPAARAAEGHRAQERTPEQRPSQERASQGRSSEGRSAQRPKAPARMAQGQPKARPRNDRPRDTNGGKKPRRRRGPRNAAKPETSAFAMFERVGPAGGKRQRAHRVAYP